MAPTRSVLSPSMSGVHGLISRASWGCEPATDPEGYGGTAGADGFTAVRNRGGMGSPQGWRWRAESPYTSLWLTCTFRIRGHASLSSPVWPNAAAGRFLCGPAVPRSSGSPVRECENAGHAIARPVCAAGHAEEGTPCAEVAQQTRGIVRHDWRGAFDTTSDVLEARRMLHDCRPLPAGVLAAVCTGACRAPNTPQFP
jgi:hypothetical protein